MHKILIVASAAAMFLALAPIGAQAQAAHRPALGKSAHVVRTAPRTATAPSSDITSFSSSSALSIGVNHPPKK